MTGPRTSTEVNCQQCGKSFWTAPNRIKSGRGKYCSKECADLAHSTSTKRICKQCGNGFTVPARSAARFCSRMCWFTWHRGVNNEGTNRISVSCHHCGKPLERIPFRIRNYSNQYCSRACSIAEHGKKITGEKHPNWHGGCIATRGPSWQKSRAETISRQDHRCLDCGMTEDEHIAKYGCSFDVHHRSPYRLSTDNSPDNLIALCKACHAKEESKTRNALSPADIEAMLRRTAEMRELGLDRIDDKSRHKNPCPKCGKPKEKRASLCRACSSFSRRRIR